MFSNTGEPVAEFGAPRQFVDAADIAQNRFMNRGLLVAGPDDSLFFVFTHAVDAIVEQWNQSGRKLREFSLDGAAIRRQGDAATRLLAVRSVGPISGGLATVTAASFDPETGHLWFGTTAGLNMPNVYEYSVDGQKLAEYRLHADTGFLGFVSDILVRRGTAHAISQNTVYSFPLPEAVRRDHGRPPGR
jgi:hypothetical protein